MRRTDATATLRKAAKVIRDAIEGVRASDVYITGSVPAACEHMESIGFNRGDVAAAVADLLENVAHAAEFSHNEDTASIRRALVVAEAVLREAS